MVPHVVEVRYVTGHTLWLRFEDGAEGEVDLGADLTGDVSEPMIDRDPFRVHSELKTVAWPNGADFAPGFLRAALRVVA